MMVLAALLLAADPAPLNLQPFADEQAAGRALEEHLYCLANHAFERRNENGDVTALAGQIIAACIAEAASLRAALTDVYARKPQLLPAGTAPAQAAEFYVNEMNGRVEGLIQEGRRHR